MMTSIVVMGTFMYLPMIHFLLSVLISITAMGAVGDGKTLNTQAINHAIETCAARGGGVVSVPSGVFVTGTVHMKSGVTLRLEPGAVLQGTDDLSAYEPLHLIKDLSRYESGRGTVNYNAADDPVWSLSLISFVGVDHAGIEGTGIIDGHHVFNPKGEEHQRGPHTILIANSTQLHFRDFTINRSANYALLAYEIDRTTFQNLHINEGWDGIHIRGAYKVKIRQCEIHTGDDAIAGGYWDHLTIRQCILNSSCNGIRMIQPSSNVVVDSCRIYGPGRYPHRTSGNTSSLAAINLEPGAWGEAPGALYHITLKRILATSVLTPLSVTLGDDNSLDGLTVSHFTAHDVTRMAASVKSWGNSRSTNVRLSHCDFQFRGIDDPSLPAWFQNRPTSECPVFPSYGLYFRNVDGLRLRDVKTSYTGKEYREAAMYDGVTDLSVR